MPIRLGLGISTRPSKSGSRPEMIRNKVVLPQPDGPKSAQISPCRRPNATSRSTVRIWPDAARKTFRETETSNSMHRPPAGDTPLERLHKKSFYGQHESNK